MDGCGNVEYIFLTAQRGRAGQRYASPGAGEFQVALAGHHGIVRLCPRALGSSLYYGVWYCSRVGQGWTGSVFPFCVHLLWWFVLFVSSRSILPNWLADD